MSHPSETRLALYAGRELGVWSRWAVSRHVSRCSQCHDQVRAFVADKERLRRACAEFPAGLEWERLASEMTANIRVGLAAGEHPTSPPGFGVPAAASTAPPGRHRA